MGPSQICGCPFREPRVFEIAHYVNKEGPDLQCRGSQLQLWDFALQRLVWRSWIPQWAEAAESFKNWERRRWRKFTWSVCLSLSAVLTSGPKSRILCWKSMQLWCRRHAGDEGSSSEKRPVPGPDRCLFCLKALRLVCPNCCVGCSCEACITVSRMCVWSKWRKCCRLWADKTVLSNLWHRWKHE